MPSTRSKSRGRGSEKIQQPTPIEKMKQKFKMYKVARQLMQQRKMAACNYTKEVSSLRQQTVATWNHKFVSRFFMSFAFFVAATYLNCVMTVIAGYRTPQQPPLPDIAHRYLPVDKLADILGADLVRRLPDYFVQMHLAIAILMTIVNKNRSNMIKRFITIFGFINFLRAITVTVTLLPDMSPHCLAQFQNQQPGGSGHYKNTDIFPNAFGRAWKLMMSPDTTTCGDLIFSGHTSLFVLTCCFVSQYLNEEIHIPMNLFVVPKHWYLSSKTVHVIKGLNKVLTLLGMLAILATKFHYTIDVLLAFYLCSTVFTSYHQHAFLMGKFAFVSSDSKDPFFRVIQFLEDVKEGEDAVEKESGGQEEDVTKIERTAVASNDISSFFLQVAMFAAGICISYIIFQSFVANTDYNQEYEMDNEIMGNKRYIKFGAKMRAISSCIGKCYK